MTTANERAACAVAIPVQLLRVLVVDSRALHALVAPLLQSAGNALGVTGAEVRTFCTEELAFDIVFLAVRSSTLEAMSLAAHLRAIERQKSQPGRAAIIACTDSISQYVDCLVPGSALSGALDSPWTAATVHACLDRWRDGKLLPALAHGATRMQ